MASFKAETGDKSRAQQNPPLKCIHVSLYYCVQIPCPYNYVLILQPEFLEAFDGGEGRAFFELWNEHVPSFVRSSNSTSHHLECNISAYFAVYPIRTGVREGIVIARIVLGMATTSVLCQTLKMGAATILAILGGGCVVVNALG